MLRKVRNNSKSPAWAHLAVAAPIVHFCLRHGIPINAYFHRHLLPQFDPENTDIVVPLQCWVNLINDLARREGIDNFGKEVVKNSTTTQLSWKFADSKAFTLMMALREFSERLRNMTSTRFHIEECGQSVRYYRSEDHGVHDEERNTGLYAMEVHLQLIRRYLGEGWNPIKIGAPYIQVYKSDIGRHFPHSVVEYTDNSWFIEVDRNLLGSEKLECREQTAVNSQNLENELTPLSSASMTEALIRVIMSYLPHKFFSVEELAELFGVRPRTLQRRLAAEGTNFSSVASIARLNWAKNRLENSGEKVIDIGLSVGYASHACFSRAFKQYSGATPTEFRAHLLHSEA